MKGLTVQIEDIPPGGLAVSFGEEPSSFELEAGESQWLSPVRGDCRLQRFGREVICRGELQATLLVECSRCLRKLLLPVSVDLSATFQPEVPSVTEEELELEAEDFDTYSYEAGGIDLREAIRDHLGSAVPIQPLCRPDCAGLCPRCGKDLNEGPCHCPSEAGDSRWAALARLQGGLVPPGSKRDATTEA